MPIYMLIADIYIGRKDIYVAFRLVCTQEKISVDGESQLSFIPLLPDQNITPVTSTFLSMHRKNDSLCLWRLLRTERVYWECKEMT